MTLRQALHVQVGNARVSPEALTLDTVRAARGLGLDATALREALGGDDRSIDRLLGCELTLAPETSLGESALLLVRLHRALGDVFGSLDQVEQWLTTHDKALGGRPRDLLRTRSGLMRLAIGMEKRCKDCLW